MIRIKRGLTVRKKHSKIIEQAKGYSDRTSSLRIAYQRIKKAMQYQYRDRRRKKTIFSKQWITQINNASRQYDFTYSQLINILKQKNILINNKIIAHLSTYEPITFHSLFNLIQNY